MSSYLQRIKKLEENQERIVEELAKIMAIHPRELKELEIRGEVRDAIYQSACRELGKWLEERLVKPLPESLLEPASFNITLKDILQLRDNGLMPSKPEEES